MHKTIVSTCSPNNYMYWVWIQYIVKKFSDGLCLATPYVQRIVFETEFSWFRHIPLETI